MSTKRLLDWFRRARRKLPWRGTRDPYRIWVSEIMLQQTRVAAVIPYYRKFLRRFPTVGALARASEESVLAAWSGLGYYSRARNLRRAARQVAAAGSFPTGYQAIRELSGVGDYTAAAVASIAFGQPYPALDGNVLRVLSRLANEGGDIGSSGTRARLRALAERLMDRRDPGLFNQSMMELGATVCLPRQPRCPQCPLAANCEARRHGLQNQLPVRRRPRRSVRIDQTILLIRRGDRILLRQRAATARRLAGFWELPEAGEIPAAVVAGEVGVFRHAITYHAYRIAVLEAKLRRKPPGFHWVAQDQLRSIPLSTAARKALALYPQQLA